MAQLKSCDTLRRAQRLRRIKHQQGHCYKVWMRDWAALRFPERLYQHRRRRHRRRRRRHFKMHRLTNSLSFDLRQRGTFLFCLLATDSTLSKRRGGERRWLTCSNRQNCRNDIRTKEKKHTREICLRSIEMQSSNDDKTNRTYLNNPTTRPLLR